MLRCGSATSVRSPLRSAIFDADNLQRHVSRAHSQTADVGLRDASRDVMANGIMTVDGACMWMHRPPCAPCLHSPSLRHARYTVETHSSITKYRNINYYLENYKVECPMAYPAGVYVSCIHVERLEPWSSGAPMHLHPSCGCGCCQVRAGDGSEVVLALSSVYCDRLKNMLRAKSLGR